MDIIKILPPQEAQKIAAGEVIERPASIVKETIENAIDAGATQISLYIKKAGKELIRIIDNGCGMSATDAKTCFYEHATSKIQTLEDLHSITSFGFRGEALSSISAISKIMLTTKSKNQELGIQLQYENGTCSSEKNVAHAIGTDLHITDLFYNTPVRKKFLKQDETEWNQILNLFYSFCLSNRTTHFKLYRDDKMVLNAPPVHNIKDRACQIWGHNFSQNLLELECLDLKEIKISGYISNHNFWRYGRQHIFFFVNARFVKNSELSKALLKGYTNVLPPARFPAACIFITIPHNEIDINVHPRKEEVKFAKPVSIQNKLQKLVKFTLESNVSKKLQTHTQETPQTPQSTPIKYTANFQTSAPPPITMPTYTTQKIIAHTPKIQTNHETEQTTITMETQPKIIGQLFKTYIMIENNNELIIIDQHAAHERILYEKFAKNFENKQGTQLMFPQMLELPNHHIDIILKEQDFFLRQGIELELFGQNQIAIKTSPPKIQNHDLKELIFEIIDFIQEHEQLEQTLFRKKLNEHMHAQMACKMAVKAGDILTFELMQHIINNLQKTENRLTCPHGRPTSWIVNKYNIEKNFKRV
jgi:DNA mismatch repair protein MutL